MHPLDSVNYVNKFDKEIPQYIMCRIWFSMISFEPSLILVFIVDGCRRVRALTSIHYSFQ